MNAKEVKLLENRTFGLIFAAIFLVIALVPLLGADDGEVRFWALVVSGGFLSISLVFPKMLAPLNTLWARFGQLMHKVTNPLLMGLVFFLSVLPIGIVMRLLRKDTLRLKRDETAETYWITREQSVIAPASFDQQF